jgi:signal peptidase II
MPVETGETPEELRVGFLLPTFIVLALDQFSKQLFWHLGRNFDIIDGLLRITLVKNSGAAFGMLQEGRIFLIVSSIVASGFIVYLTKRLSDMERAKRVFFGLILGGALGNLIDRIYPGEVIDFIDMGIGPHRWPVYNLADTAVTVGGLLLILNLSRSRERHAE